MAESTDTKRTLSLSTLLVGAKKSYDKEHFQTYGDGYFKDKETNDLKVNGVDLQPLGGTTFNDVTGASADSTALVDVEIGIYEGERWDRCAQSIQSAIKERQSEMTRLGHKIASNIQSDMTDKYDALTRDRATMTSPLKKFREILDLVETGHDVVSTAKRLGFTVHKSALGFEHCREVGSSFKTGFDGISADLSEGDRIQTLVSLYKQIHSDDGLVKTDIDSQPATSSRSTRSGKPAVKVESGYDKLQAIVERLLAEESVGLGSRNMASAVNRDPIKA